MSIILRAARIAAHYHRNQKRNSNGKPYMTHLWRVGGRACSHPRVTESGGAASFLHDILEDQAPTDALYEEIKSAIISQCSFDTFLVVRDLTNPSKGMNLSRDDRKRLDRAHMATRIPMVKTIKLIDRIDNINEFTLDTKLGLEHRPDFLLKYCEESTLLLNESLLGSDSDLEAELVTAIESLRETCTLQKFV